MNCRALDAAFRRDPPLPSLTHLRRFAKREVLPESLREAIDGARTKPVGRVPTIYVIIPPPLPDVDELLDLLAPFAPETYHSRPSPPANKSSPEPQPSKVIIVKTQIPLTPPFNIQQAQKWSKDLWPIIFNPAAPRSTVAPPKQVLLRAQDDIRPRAGFYLSLAREVAKEAESSGRGRGVGAVIVDPAIEARLEDEAWDNGSDSTEFWSEAVIAVGGDARYARSEGGAPSQTDVHCGIAPNPATETYAADVEGGPDLHALMRAVELVARRRREDPENATEAVSKEVPKGAVEDPQLSNRLTPLESHFLFEVDGAKPASGELTATALSSSPKKRKHEDPNPESVSSNINTQTINPSLSSNGAATPSAEPPLPGPPPSTIAELPNTTGSNSLGNSAKGFIDYLLPEKADDQSTTNSSRIRPRSQGGYLCTDLDVYISHEPCLCCSMGMLLSRFRAVVFPRSGRMESGGLASEPVVSPTAVDEHEHNGNTETGEKTNGSSSEDRLYYGLHWRKELNWRALGFEFVVDGEDSPAGGVVFHA